MVWILRYLKLCFMVFGDVSIQNFELDGFTFVGLLVHCCYVWCVVLTLAFVICAGFVAGCLFVLFLICRLCFAGLFGFMI